MNDNYLDFIENNKIEEEYSIFEKVLVISSRLREIYEIRKINDGDETEKAKPLFQALAEFNTKAIVPAIKDKDGNSELEEQYFDKNLDY